MEIVRALSDRTKTIKVMYLQCLVLFYALTSYSEGEITDLIDLNGLNLNYNQTDSEIITYFRGHSDYSFPLMPSIYRNYDSKKYGGSIDKVVLHKLYDACSLISKYDDIFGFESVNYDFLSYIQHSRSYSPILDLTDNHMIALSFATNSSIDLGKYMNCDAAIFQFLFRRHNVTLNSQEKIDSFRVDFYTERFDIDSMVKDTPLFLCTYEMFKPDICLYNEKLNDRMKYQRGSFLLLNNITIVNSTILMPISFGKIIKYRIGRTEKIEIYNAICSKFKKYDINHLMNPYKYFEESPS